MKGRWESNINVWFPFMYSQNWNCYFRNRIIMICLPVPTLTYLLDLYISRIGLPIPMQGIVWTDPGNIYIAHRYMNVEIGTEAAQFPEKEYINGIFLAVRRKIRLIETNSKCRHLKKMCWKRTLRQVYLSRPPPLPGFGLGWSSNIVGSESGQIQNVKLLQNMFSNKTQHPPPLPPNHRFGVFIIN